MVGFASKYMFRKSQKCSVFEAKSVFLVNRGEWGKMSQ